jgi:beta-lactamase regulating signal transducer with metallopeptidase domain
MISFLFRHLFESTLFCLLLSLLASMLRTSATARHAVWLIAVGKFAIPTVLLAKTGAEIAFFWPAADWLSSVANEVSAALLAILGMLPAGIETTALAVWVLGAVSVFTIWFARLRDRAHASTLPSERELAALAAARALLPVRASVGLRISDTGIEPALRGIWQPTIIVPAGLSQTLSEAEFEAVLLHELAHARRLDNLAAVFVHVLVCLFWFHPLLWLVERRLLVERERACDELVVACGMQPQVYATGILKVCKFHLLGQAAGISAMTGADLWRRLELILDNRVSTRLLYVPPLLVAALAVLMTLVPIAGGYCQQCVSNGRKPAGRKPAGQRLDGRKPAAQLQTLRSSK